MKPVLTIPFLIILIPLILGVSLSFASLQETTRTFVNVKSLEISTIRGDCIFKSVPENEITVTLIQDYSPENFLSTIKKEGSALIIKEDIAGPCAGFSKWIITAPRNTHIRFASFSGDIDIEGFCGMIQGETASGDVSLRNCRGKFQIDNAPNLIDSLILWLMEKAGIAPPTGRRV